LLSETQIDPILIIFASMNIYKLVMAVNFNDLVGHPFDLAHADSMKQSIDYLVVPSDG